jgi:MFS family permease
VTGLKQVLRNKNYVRFFLATFASQMGGIIGVTAFMFYLLKRFTNQPYYATLAELMYSLPMLVVFLVVGVLADRMDRQKIAVNCDWISAFLSLCLLIFIWVDSIPLIFALLFIRSAASKFFFPAESAIIQGILNEEDYTIAAGLNQMMGSLFMLFGGTLGAVVYWHFGITGAILIDAVSFIVSALLIRSCKIPKEVRLPNGAHQFKQLKFKLVMIDFKQGFLYILRNRLLLWLVSGFFMFGILNGGFSVLPMFILKYKLAPDNYEQYMVWTGIIFGAGVLLGTLIASLISAKLKLHQMIAAGVLVAGMGMCTLGFVNHLYAFLIINFVIALILPFINIGIGGWLPRIVDPQMMGRVQGLINPLMMLSQSLTLGFIAVSFPSFIPIELLFLLVGVCTVIVGIYYTIVLPRYADYSTSSKALQESL